MDEHTEKRRIQRNPRTETQPIEGLVQETLMLQSIRMRVHLLIIVVFVTFPNSDIELI